MNNWNAVVGDGARLKRIQLEREICKVQDETLRSNLLHTFSKLFMFLEDDLGAALRVTEQAERDLLDGWKVIGIGQTHDG